MTDRRIYKVSELVTALNLELSSRWRELWIEGEVTNVRPASTGHLYFSIKDERSQLKIVMFGMFVRALKFKIENGQKLILRGRLNIYDPRGDLQMIADTAEPAGIGALQLAFEQLKARLQAEGLFDPDRKKPLPMFPQRIAVVTSPQGAAIRDILQVLGRRFDGLSIQIYPVRVQGPTAAREIAAALGNLSRWKRHDVVLICRGGGSLEDLWPFNEEIVARAVAACSIPTISGVGHEIDSTICDFVADLRAPTPSAAAEIVIRAKSEVCLQIDEGVRRIRHVLGSRLTRYRHELRHLASSDGIGLVPRRVTAYRDSLQRRRVSLYQLLGRSATSMRRRLEACREPLAKFPARLALADRKRLIRSFERQGGIAIRTRLTTEQNRLQSLLTTLEAVSPLSVLARGYAIAFTTGRRPKPIQDAAKVGIGDTIEVRLRRGRLNCTVDGKTLGVESLWPVPAVEDESSEREHRAGTRE